MNNQTFLVEDQNEGEPVTPCMDVYKAKIQSYGSLDKLRLNFCLVHIHTWSYRFTFILIFNQESMIVDCILYILDSFLQPRFLYVL